MLRTASLVLLASLAACSSQTDNSKLATQEAKSEQSAADDGRISCALEGAKLFDRTCTLVRMTSGDGPILIVGRDDVGFRRLLVTSDGRGVVSADGAEAAKVAIAGDGLIEVTVGKDRYRLPAEVKGQGGK